jgi:hypothetical protein
VQSHRLMMSASVGTTESALWLPFRTSRPRPVVLRTGAYQGVFEFNQRNIKAGPATARTTVLRIHQVNRTKEKLV